MVHDGLKGPLSRRAVLRGAGTTAIALPFLEAMNPRRASAQADGPRRLLVFFTPGGVSGFDKWLPSGAPGPATGYKFQTPAMAALEPWKPHLTVLDGLRLSVSYDPGNHGHPHGKGMGGVLTGQTLAPGNYDGGADGPSGFATGVSVDQVIAAKASAGRRYKSLELGVNWPTGGSHFRRIAPWSVLSYEAPQKPIPPATDPHEVFAKLFGNLGGDEVKLAAQRKRAQSILDGVTKQYTRFIARLGAADRAKLDAHLTKIREVEVDLTSANAPQPSGCTKPDIGARAFDPQKAREAVNGDANVNTDGNAQSNAVLDPATPAISKQMMDLMTMALRCDLTRVGTLMWFDSTTYNTMPWLGLTSNYHAYQHFNAPEGDDSNPVNDGGAGVDRANRWFTEQFTAMLGRMADPAFKENDRTLLDNTIILWCSEIGICWDHDQRKMPFLLAGGGGGAVRPGRWLKYNAVPHNNLLVSLVNMFGGDVKTFGHAAHCTGALSGLV
jgi:hypothetical protein